MQPHKIALRTPPPSKHKVSTTMTTTEDENLTNLTGQIINAAFEVSNTIRLLFNFQKPIID